MEPLARVHGPPPPRERFWGGAEGNGEKNAGAFNARKFNKEKWSEKNAGWLVPEPARLRRDSLIAGPESVFKRPLGLDRDYLTVLHIRELCVNTGIVIIIYDPNICKMFPTFLKNVEC